MIRSALFRRVYLSVFVALVLMAVLIWSLFVYLSDSVFLNLRVNELVPRAESLSSIVSGYLRGEISEGTLLSLVDTQDRSSSIIDAYMLVSDASGEILVISDTTHMPRTESMDEYIKSILSGKKIVKVESGGIAGDIVILGLPVYEGGGSISGALILYVPQYEALAARGALAGSLALSMAIIVPAMFLILYIFLYRVIRPLRQMRDVALRMADGRFDLRANEEAVGEIGELGSCINRLSKNLKHTISDLTFERNRLIQILNGMTEGIAAVDRLINITHINPSLVKLFNQTPLSDDPHMRVIGHEEIWKAFRDAVNNGSATSLSVKENGRDIRCSIAPVRNDSGEIAGAVGLFMDVSKEVQLEMTRREFVANVSHEMRTPLTAIRGLIEPMKDGMVTNEDAKKRYYDIILREVLRLSRLINDLMELSRLQSGSVSIEPEKFNFFEMIEGIREKYDAICREHSLALECGTDFSAFPPLYASADRVEQLLGILIDNAVKYTPSGGKITLSGEIRGQKAHLTVRDTGMGISKDHIEHVFDRFYKVDKAHSGMGSGLGLSIAKEMLLNMGETISVESEEGKGSAFTFTVQVYTAELQKKLAAADKDA